jgi:hypothetical protein
MAEEFLKLVRKRTIKGGRVQQGLYNDMMDEYSDHMNILLTPEQQAKITNLGSMGRVVDEMATRTEQLGRKLANQFGEVVGNPTSPFNIAEEILGPRMDSGQATKLMGDLRALPDPRLAQQVEEKVMERIFNDVSKSDKKVIDFTTLDNLLATKRDTLQAVGGKRYVFNLDKMRNALEILTESRHSRAARELPQTVWERASRLLFGPLSRAQRTISAVSRGARSTRAGTVSKLLKDPNALDQFVRLKNLSPRNPRFWVGAQLIGDDVLDAFIQLAPEEWAQFQSGELEDRQRARSELADRRSGL